MRFSTSFVLAAAIGAYALPQDVQPISQISDGQIQAPPATAAPVTSGYAVPSEAPSVSEVPSAPAATEVLPSVTPVPLPSVVPSSGYIPAPIPSAPANVSVPAVSSGVSYPNSTVPLSTGGSTSAPASSSSGAAPSESAPINNGATANMASFAVVAAALLAFLA